MAVDRLLNMLFIVETRSSLRSGFRGKPFIPTASLVQLVVGRVVLPAGLRCDIAVDHRFKVRDADPNWSKAKQFHGSLPTIISTGGELAEWQLMTREVDDDRKRDGRNEHQIAKVFYLVRELSQALRCRLQALLDCL